MNRVALVTGGSRNTGRAIALRLARDGHDVAVLGCSDSAAAAAVADEVRALGVRAIGVTADISDPAAVESAVRTVREQLGPPVVLVCNAAYRSHLSFREISLAEWRRVHDVNLGGAFHCVRSTIDDMTSAGFGRVVVISGTSAHRWPTRPGDVHVAASKAGVEGFVRALSREFGRCGVTANSVSPGPILKTAADPAGRRYELAVGRWTGMEEVAHAVSALCHVDAGAVTGQTILVDGGGPVYGREE